VDRWTKTKPNLLTKQQFFFSLSLYVPPPPLPSFSLLLYLILHSTLLTPFSNIHMRTLQSKSGITLQIFSRLHISVTISQWQPSCVSAVVAGICTPRNFCSIYTLSSVWWYMTAVNFMSVGFCIMTPVIWWVNLPLTKLHGSVVQKPQSCRSIDLSWRECRSVFAIEFL